MKVLFVTWDGPAQSYLTDLFLPIFGRLQGSGYAFEILQFTTGGEPFRRATRIAAERIGIAYTARSVWRRPLALSTAGMIALGSRFVASQVRRSGVDVVMPRSTIPAAMCLLAARSIPLTPILFDADGFMPDERVEFQGWNPDGLQYRLLRDIDATAARRAQAVLVRSTRARQILLDRAGPGLDPERIHVVLNGRDPSVYHPGGADARAATRARLGVAPEAPFVVYVGSLGEKYLPDRILAFFQAVRRRAPDARFQVLTGNQEIVDELLPHYDLPPECLDVRRVAGAEVPEYLAAADLGVAFINSGFSVQATAPIKIGEYLLCGTPVLATPWAGDTREHLRLPETGRVLDDVSDAALADAAQWFVDDLLPRRAEVRTACRERGIELFSLDRAVHQYECALSGIRAWRSRSGSPGAAGARREVVG
ncbi:MAG TPA: glycosyltransferase family 4 protein [Longimicrobiaceae bacterium]